MKEEEIKENDIFKWKYTNSHIDTLKYKSDLYHCKERLAIAKISDRGIILYDTFWGVGRTDNHFIELKDVGEKYDIEFYCNLNDIEKKDEHIKKHYDDKDIFILHDQHACAQSCVYHYLKKGAVRSKDKMILILNNQIKGIENTIEYGKSDLQKAKETLIKIENGEDLNSIYI